MFIKKKKTEEIDILKNTSSYMDKILPDVVEEGKDYLYLHYNKYMRTFVLTIYPERTWVGWLQDLYFIGNISISVKVEPTSSALVINQLTRKLVQNQSEYTTYMKQGNIAHTPVLEKEMSDLEELRTLIQTNQDKLYFVTVFIALTCESIEELNEKSKILESEISKKTAMLRTLAFRQLDGLKAILPLGTHPIAKLEQNMVSGGVATLIPIANPEVTHKEGIFLGRNYYTNAPAYLNTFIGPPSLPNPHIFVCRNKSELEKVWL